MSALRPDLAAYFASLGTLFPAAAGGPTPLERRARYWALVGLRRTPLPSSVTMNDVQPDLASGKVGVRLFYGHDGADEPVPTIIYFHGGGWVVGRRRHHTVTCARLAHEANALVVSVDYPLAPKHTGAPSPMPASKLRPPSQRIVWRKMLVFHRPGGRQRRRASPPSPRCARDEGNFTSRCRRLLYPTVAPDFDTELQRVRRRPRPHARRHAVVLAALRGRRSGGERPPHRPHAPCRTPACPCLRGHGRRDPLRDEGRSYVQQPARRGHRGCARRVRLPSAARLSAHGEVQRRDRCRDCTANRRIGELLLRASRARKAHV